MSNLLHKSSMYFRILGTWVLFIPIAITNGIIRERIYKPYVGDLYAHQISTVTASIAFLLLAYVMLKNKVSSLKNRELFTIGFIWVVMTICFEFGFGHYVDKASWEALLADYNMFEGRVWALFLVIIFISPYSIKVFKSLQKKSTVLL